MEKRLKWQPMEIDLRAFMRFVRSRGAVSIKEIKDHFHTDSASTRRTIGFLYHHNKVWLIAYGRGIYVTENTGKKGSVSIPALRKEAGVVGAVRGPKRKVKKGQVPVFEPLKRNERFEDGRLIVDMPEYGLDN